MFTVNTNTGILRIRFKHLTSYKGERYTECHLLNEDKTNIDVDYAVCNPADNFERSVGRKLSLTRILSRITDKNTRQQIWQEYFRLHKR